MEFTSARSHPTIGLLVQRLDSYDGYNKRVWKEAYDLARQRSCNLLMVAGYSPDGPDSLELVRTATYHLLNRRLLDGGIVSLTVTARMDSSRLECFAGELPDIPLVSASLRLGTRPCFGVDNAPGMRQIMRHLIYDHHCRRIVHIRGPHPNPDAAERAQIWREELVAAGIEPLDSWLVPGHFDLDKLPGIGAKVLEQTGGAFDAIVGCNDLSAICVMEELKSLGYRAPHDYLLGGFDDIRRCQFEAPSLTTVRQPLAEQVRACWDGLEAWLRTGSLPPESTQNTSLVVRASCSCPSTKWSLGAFADLEKEAGELPVLDQDLQPGSLPGREWLSILSSLEKKREGFEKQVFVLHNFIRSLNLLMEVEDLPQVLHEWLPQLGISQFALYRCCSLEGVAGEYTCLWDENLVLPSHPEAFRLMASLPEAAAGSDVVLRWDEFAPMAWLSSVEPFVLGLFPLALGSTWHGVVFLQLPREAGLLERAVQEQLISAMDRLAREKANRERVSQARAQELAQTEKIVALRRLISEISHEVNTPLGAIVSSGTYLDEGLEAWARDWIEASLGESVGQTGFQSLLQAAMEPNLEVAPHSDRALRNLYAETLADLNVPHPDVVAEDLMTLGYRGSAQDLPSLVQVPGFATVVGRLSKLADLRTSSRLISLASHRIEEFLSRLKSSAQPPQGGSVGLVDLRHSLETALLFLRVEFQRGVEVVRDFQNVPPVACHGEEIQQVWINLVRNAIQAMDHKGKIFLKMGMEDGWVRVDVTDHGPGMSPEVQAQVFTPFFTTKPEGEGLGLGLDITRRIVEGVGGRIEFESQPGRTTFSVWLSTLPPPASGAF